ncbi:MAG: inositol monophosphatase [Verrucomicrobiae bacterium]|nr:inositol monophosphatase [Verrucomicrobiae bacterium]
MTQMELKRALETAQETARAAGALMRRELGRAKEVKETHAHDIKLALDVECQKLIERRLHKVFPRIPVLGEEGRAGEDQGEARWVVDPIDGTVNFAHGIPHACVSIALQVKTAAPPKGVSVYPDGYATMAGVVYDPFTEELWTADWKGPARLNGKVVRVSKRARLAEAVVATGFSKSPSVIRKTLRVLNRLSPRVRKVRIMGAAALSLAYVAGGRMDLYLEQGVRLWDIAAGGLLVERAGGRFEFRRQQGEHRYWMLGENGRVGEELRRVLGRPG